MSKFNVEQIRELMDHQENIRNMSVIAHVDHGKSTLTDALICKAGLLSEDHAGSKRWTDKDEKQIEKGITIKSTGVSMCFNYKEKEVENKYLINLIDSPGHVDFSSEVTAALRVTDGALVVVDTVEGVCVQTETVLRQAMQERIRPALMINKVDRAIMELKQDGEQIYQNFVKVIDKVNVVVSIYQNQIMGDLQLDPIKGNVIFGAGKDQWAFTLSQFAKIYSGKFGIDENKMARKLWGDNYFDAQAKKWKIEPVSDSGKPLKRAFVQFIMDPIIKMITAIVNSEPEEMIEKMLAKIEVNLTQDDKKLKDKKLMKAVMRKWLPAADCIIQVMVKHLPSPIQAQKYRASYLYEGEEPEVLEAITKCDPKGPLMIYISKMVPIEDGRFAAFGRVFSGTISTGDKIKIIGPNYKEGSKNDYHEKKINSTMIMIGSKAETIPSVICGNTVAITGIDQYLLKSGTLSSMQTKKNNSIRPMKYSVSPVFKVAVRPVNPIDLPRLIEGLRKLVKADPLVLWQAEETGENIVAGCGELHIEICIHELKKYTGKEIIVSEPIVSYRQTVTTTMLEPELVKTNNKKNRFYGTVEPINEKLIDLIENGDITAKDDPKERGKKLTDEFGWDKDDASRIWVFGPEDIGSNIVVDQIKGVQYVNEVKDSICSAFQWASKEGVLTGENMRGIKFNLTDALIHPDPAHRRGAQVVPSSRRLFHGLELTARPTLQEPILMCEITAPNDAIGGIYQTLNQRRGAIIDENQLEGSLSIIKAYLPVSTSYGFAEDLRGNTQGKAFPQCFFDHWQNISGLPYEDPKATNLILEIRKRKGMKEELPNQKDYLDKL